MTLEEMTRKILHQAIQDGLVKFNEDYHGTKVSEGRATCVHAFTAGDLVGTANVLSELISHEIDNAGMAADHGMGRPELRWEKPPAKPQPSVPARPHNPDDDIPF